MNKANLLDKIYLVDPLDDDGQPVESTEDVCWCADPAGDVNVGYIAEATVAAALEKLRIEMASMVVSLPADYWIKRLDAIHAKLGLQGKE